MTPNHPPFGQVSATDVEQAREDVRARRRTVKRAMSEYRLMLRALVFSRFSFRLRVQAGRVEGKPVFALIVATVCFGLAALVLALCFFTLDKVLIGAAFTALLAGAVTAFLLYYPRDAAVVESLTQLPTTFCQRGELLEHLVQEADKASDRYRRLRRAWEEQRTRTRLIRQGLGGEVLLAIGVLFLVGGLLTTLYYWVIFDTSVYVGWGERVHNLGLLNQRLVGTIIGVGAAILGAMFCLAARHHGSNGQAKGGP